VTKQHGEKQAIRQRMDNVTGKTFRPYVFFKFEAVRKRLKN
jgi:hypothetical protein